MNRTKNQDMRTAIENAGLKYWEVADRLGLSDGNFSRKLRHELPPETKERIYAIINELSEN